MSLDAPHFLTFLRMPDDQETVVADRRAALAVWAKGDAADAVVRNRNGE